MQSTRLSLLIWLLTSVTASGLKLNIPRFVWNTGIPVCISLKGQFPWIKQTHSPRTFTAIYPSTLFRCELPSFGGYRCSYSRSSTDLFVCSFIQELFSFHWTTLCQETLILMIAQDVNIDIGFLLDGDTKIKQFSCENAHSELWRIIMSDQVMISAKV